MERLRAKSLGLGEALLVVEELERRNEIGLNDSHRLRLDREEVEMEEERELEENSEMG